MFTAVCPTGWWQEKRSGTHGQEEGLWKEALRRTGPIRLGGARVPSDGLSCLTGTSRG